jgi:hypothetical protein
MSIDPHGKNMDDSSMFYGLNYTDRGKSRWILGKSNAGTIGISGLNLWIKFTCLLTAAVNVVRWRPSFGLYS